MKGLLLLLLVAFVSAKVSYDGHQVWRIQNDNRHEHLNEILYAHNLDVWSHARTTTDVRVSPSDQKFLSVILARFRFTYKPMIPDIGVLLKAEEEAISKQPRAFALDQYNTFEDIEGYLQGLPATSSLATLSSLGKSVEGRDLWQLKLSAGTGRAALWLDFNIHAREWITAATGLYGIDLIINGYPSDPDVAALLDKYDLYIMVVNNPDGYAFTQTDRLWRKNRNKYPDDTCYGIDINRNFDDHFGGEGTSGIACDQTYRGPSAASEPETQATQDGIKALRASANLNVLFSIHSYSQLWMYPYGWTDAVSPDDAELGRVAQIGVDALTAVSGTLYELGPVSTTIYPAASTTIDYSYAQGVTYSYTIELRDTGEFGFLLPAAQIAPTGKETWAGIMAAVAQIP